MKERPILFSASMVRAILEGRKTQTRRMVKPQPEPGEIGSLGRGVPFIRTERRDILCPYGQPGDRLWVREAFGHAHVINLHTGAERFPLVYRADFADDYDMFDIIDHRWRPSIHLKRSDSRILLEVIGVRVERLKDISEADARAEGIIDGHFGGNVEPGFSVDGMDIYADSAQDMYRELWESINGPGSWDVNPWVWVVEFRRMTP